MTLSLHNPVKKANKIPAIKAFIQTSFLDWRSQICSVVFLGRCNFRCPYCHNRDLVLWPQKLPDLPLQDIRDFLSSHGDWLDGIVISGGEPCLDQDLPNLINEFRNLGLKIKLDTNGSQPEHLKRIIKDGLVDYVAMDFKAPLNEFSYRRCTGVWTDVKAIGQSLDLLLEGNVDYEFRVTVCPGLLDVEDIKHMGESIDGAERFVLQNFVPQNTLDISMSELAPFTMEKLEKMKQVISHNVKECLIISSY